MYTISKNNTTGVRGVTFESYSHKYRAYIHVGGEKISLGYFSCLQDAAKARKDAEDFYKTPLTGRLRLVDFICDKYGLGHEKALSGVIDCLKGYEFGGVGFMTYVVSAFDSGKSIAFVSEPTIPGSDILVQWINGMSINQIAKQKKGSAKAIKKIIEYEIRRIKYGDRQGAVEDPQRNQASEQRPDQF